MSYYISKKKLLQTVNQLWCIRRAASHKLELESTAIKVPKRKSVTKKNEALISLKIYYKKNWQIVF